MLLKVDQLKKEFADKIVFEDVTFSVSPGDRIGIIGVNGTGKSTLLHILAGQETADFGELHHPNDYRIRLLSQSTDYPEDQTVMQVLLSGNTPTINALRHYEVARLALEQDPTNETLLTRFISAQTEIDAANAWDTESRLKMILNKLGITNLEATIGSLSGGQRKRVGLAEALLDEADLLLLDEPTNELDAETITWLESQIKEYRGAILIITHDRYFLNRVTNHMMEIANGTAYFYVGNYESFLEKRSERRERTASMEEKRQNILRRELAWLRRGAKARTTKQKARIQRVDALQELSYEEEEATLEVQVGSTRLGKKVIEALEVGQQFGDRTLFDGFNWLFGRKERYGIVGRNGSGKSTLLSILAKRLEPTSGEVIHGETVKVGFYGQFAEFSHPERRVIEEVERIAQVITTLDGQEITASQMLEQFLFKPEAQYKPIGKLSGGEKRRLKLLTILMDEPNVLFLDEPTNDLDTETLSVLEDYLDSFPGTVITVSHDRYFLDRAVDRLLAFEEGHVVSYYGQYTDYLEQRELPIGPTDALSLPKEPTVTETRTVEAPKKLSYQEQLDWKSIESQIEEAELLAESLEQQLASSGSDIGQVNDLYQQIEHAKAQIDQLMEYWTYLSEKIEAYEQFKK
ncbi:ABC-F family ATP-binding cassette domain-containing protein [Exiguobacterium sp. S22-S28]|uniref:ABC-F family ATP-binding cassette domain-containing protein n=1 Tax=Exiguobacterium sp. S22-S28 TaxID=3342768 RepID=UPI00372D4AD9